MNRKSRTAACRSPEQTRPRLLTRCRAPAAAACSHVAAGSTRRAPLPPDQGSILLVAPHSGQPGRPRYEWIARSAQTRGQDRQDHVRHERDPPSDGETRANTVGVFWASVAPLAKASGCPPIRVNPSLPASRALLTAFYLAARRPFSVLDGSHFFRSGANSRPIG